MNAAGVSAVLLAAGESRRMGAANKLSLDILGVPLLRRAALTLLGARLGEILVVLGHEAHFARSLIADLPLRAVENPHYREGQMTSVHCGLQTLEGSSAGVMVCLCDQPLLESTDLDLLIRTFLTECARSVLVPTYEGQRGNPVILPDVVRAAIVAGDRTLGGGRPVETYSDLVVPLEMPNDHCVFDLDTPEDYEDLQWRLSRAPIRSGAETGLGER
jgi:molybdenum cofactor cytidylyltransferase